MKHQIKTLQQSSQKLTHF